MKHNFFQSTGFVFLIISLFFIIIPLFEFQTFSPDSIRFLHFWQNSFSPAYSVIEDNTFKVTIFASNIYDALHASNYYDLGRGRLIIYLIYGIENILLYSFDALPVNFLIIAIIIVNSHGASLLVSRNVSNFKFYIYALSFLLIAINAISLSPTMYFALYSKYVCLTFIVYFFIFRNSFLKILMLFLASFTDEIGLLLSLMICFFYILQYYLLRLDSKAIDTKSLLKNIFFSASICLMLLASFFLIILLAFDTTPLQFAKYAARGTLWLLDPENLLNKLIQLAWTFEILILGFSNENNFFLTIFGFSILIILLIFIKIKFKEIKLFFSTNELSRHLINFQSYPKQSMLVFWILATLLLLIVLPSSPFAYQTYAYPIMLSLAIILLLSASMKMEPTRFLQILVLIGVIHLTMIPETVSNINTSNQKHFLKDSSVSAQDINNLNTAINEIRINQNYEMFHNLNNSQEIDFSGKWYYSLEEHYRFPYETDNFGNCIEKNNHFGNCITKNNYYPVYGNTRVLAWPHFETDKAGKSKRQFSKNKPTYKDLN
tara:strand:- start:148 stop:1785 length:1638 start_codon:yes stop_codon:yes gene_type:complete